jgi:polyhydroxyalkanoate synthesis repressor PhaR
MPIIKRYPNRKLYNTEAKQYVTLEGIAELIRKGQEVHVLDHATGEDLTAVTLTQIVFEQEKKESGFVPRSVLKGLVEAGGNTLSALQRSLASPLGLWGQVDQEITRRLEVLIARGELTQEEGTRLRDRLLAETHPLPEAEWPTEQAVQQALVKRGVPTRDEFQRLADQIEKLTAQIESSQKSSTPTPRQKRTRRQTR